MIYVACSVARSGVQSIGRKPSPICFQAFTETQTSFDGYRRWKASALVHNSWCYRYKMSTRARSSHARPPSDIYSIHHSLPFSLFTSLDNTSIGRSHRVIDSANMLSHAGSYVWTLILSDVKMVFTKPGAYFGLSNVMAGAVA